MPSTARTNQRVALYVRVSTARQAEGELSIPDQINQGQAFCTARGLRLVETFVEAGASATDDRPPEFQRMVDAATGAARPFDLVVVHSMSRFFREQFLSEMYIRKLRKAGVAVISMTQDFQDDTTGNLIRQILGSLDEYQSRENGKHTLRAMRENARQGFWNGARPPFGYRTTSAKERGQKVKKVLAIDEAEAAVVREIFDLALGRAAMPLGVKAIVNRMNGMGHQNRGKPFHISSIHRILTATTYTGAHHFNRREARTGRGKESREWIALTVPQVIATEDFEAVQASLHSRNPRRVPPRIVGNPTLLTGLARCATCGSGMTLRTGKSGRYRYYTCAGCAQKGKTVCPGRSISMAALDGMVLEHLADRLFTPERLTVILEAFIARSATADTNRRAQLAQARRALTEVEGRINRLLALVERGLIDVNDPSLKERLDSARLARQAAGERVRLLDGAAKAGGAKITSEKLRALAAALRGVMRDGDPAFRKAYLRLFVDQVVVGDADIRLRGPTEALARAASSAGLPHAAGVVPSFVREWRPVRDSNPCYQRERLVSWASRRTGQTHPAGARRWVAEGLSTVKATWSAGGCVGDDEPGAHRTIPFFRTQMTGEVQRQSSACKHCLRQRTVARTEQHGLQARPAALAFDEGAD
jgi:site-specific DNA recombinase